MLSGCASQTDVHVLFLHLVFRVYEQGVTLGKLCWSGSGLKL